MRTLHFRRGLVLTVVSGLVVCVMLVAAGSARAAVVSTLTTLATTNETFTVSSNDLLQASLGSVDDSDLTYTWPMTRLYDGVFVPGAEGTPGVDPTLITKGTNIFLLDTSSCPNGYQVTQIDTYSGHESAVRSAQIYAVSYSTVDAPSTFVDICAIPRGTDYVSVKWSITDDETGVIATNVHSIRFIFEPANVGGYVVYKEIDIFGEPMPPLLVNHWKLDGNATASVGTDLTLAGTTASANDRNGKAGGAIDFQNAGRANTSSLSPTVGGTFSVAIWAKHRTGTQVGDYVRIVDNIFNSGFYLGTDSAASDRYLFIVHSVNAEFSNDAYGYTIDTNWHHLVGTYDAAANRSKLYVDGILVGQGTPDASPVATASLTIGANASGGEQWDGPIDDVGIWNIVLEPAKVALIHGLSTFSGLDLDDSRIDDVLAVFQNQARTASTGNALWGYSANLNHGTTIGTIGGSTAGADAFVVLGDDGSGVIYTPQGTMVSIR